MADGQPAPGSVRPINKADVHIIEPQGSELWLDVKIHAVGPKLNVAKELFPTKTNQMQGIRSEGRLQRTGSGQGHDPSGPGTIWPNCPRGTGHI